MATKLKQVIDQVDAIKPNSYTTAEKVAWISELDGNIYNDLTEWYDNYYNANDPWFRADKRNQDGGGTLPYVVERDYRDSAAPYIDGGKVKYPMPYLIVPYPYDAIYVTWLSAKIDYANGDIAKYNNAKIMFDEQYGSFMNWANRRLLHKKTRIDYL